MTTTRCDDALHPKRRRRFTRSLRALVVLAIALPLACSPAAEDPPESGDLPPERSPSEALARDLELLRDLGYTDWDDRTDDTLRSVTVFDPARTSPGYNLYTNDVDEVILMDLAGERVRTWKLPGKKFCEHAEFLPDGDLLVVCTRQALVRLSWDGDVVWEVEVPVHHDVATAPDGSVWAPFIDSRRSYLGRRVKFDGLLQVDTRGRRLRTWSTFEHLEELQRYHAPSALDAPATAEEAAEPEPAERKRWDYYHLNTVEVLPETSLGSKDPRFRAGNLLVCLRNANLVLILDRDDSSVVWDWGTGTLDAPHMPTLLANGHILVFDNGYRRGFSRILEIDPPSGEIVWSYEATPRTDFFTARRGSSQRLANGNTLICEAERGRAFEVTRSGDIVWEFWNPEIRDGKRKRIYRFTRVPPEAVEPFLHR